MDEQEYFERSEYAQNAYAEYLKAEKAYYAELEQEYYEELENSQDISKAADENNS